MEYRIRKGVLCLCYDSEWNLVITGSRDCNVRVWNTYVATRSAAVLKGHNSAVLKVAARSWDHMVIRYANLKSCQT